MKKNTLFLLVILVFSLFSVSAQNMDELSYTKTIEGSFEEITQKVKDALKNEKFSVVTEIDMDKKISEKIEDAEIKPYRILGACNAAFAYKAMQIEENIGLFLPCKILIKQLDKNSSEVVIVNPLSLMQMLGNEELNSLAEEVNESFNKVLESL